MSDFLEATVDKFAFKVATDRLYTEDHLWVKLKDDLARIGLTDYLQQTAGDVAFAEPLAKGSKVAPNDELGSIETMKTTLEIPSPLSGVIKVVNPRLEDEPELVNQDPYGEGWLVEMELTNWPVERESLVQAEVYYEQMKAEAEAELQRL